MGQRVERQWGMVAVAIAASALGCGSDPASPDDGPTPEPGPDIVFDMVVDGNRDIYAVRLNGEGLMRLTSDPADDLNPTTAGDIVVFVSLREGSADLYAVSLEGTGPTSLGRTDVRESEPALSRDGTRLAFVRGDTEALYGIWTSSAQGGSATPVFEDFGFSGTMEFTPAWSPDADQIAFMATATGRPDLFVGDAASGSVSPLVATEGRDFEPTWSPDGSYVAFTTVTDESADLYLLERATGGIRTLSTHADTEAQPSFLPDGRLVYTAWTGTGTEIRWLDPSTEGAGGTVPLPAGSEPQNPHGVWP